MNLTEQEKLKQPFHICRNVRFQVIPVSPSGTDTPLQIACFFDWTKNQEMSGGTQSVDEHFHGAIKALRQEGRFQAQTFETLLITPSKAEIPAKRLLLIGLGDPEKMTAEIFFTIGRVVVGEATKLEVSSFCLAPSIRDAGITSFQAEDISGPLTRGMVQGIETMQILAERGLIPPLKLQEIILLTSPGNLESAQIGMKNILEKENVKC